MQDSERDRLTVEVCEAVSAISPAGSHLATTATRLRELVEQEVPAAATSPDHFRDAAKMVPAPAEVPMPEPDTHCYDTDEERDVWSHSADQMRTYGDAREYAGYARGLKERRSPYIGPYISPYMES